MRTEDITTESGMRFLITDPNHADAVDVMTENLTGSNPWKPVTAEFTTGPDTHFLDRPSSATASRLFENRLSGTVWVSDAVLDSCGTRRGAAVEMNLVRNGLLLVMAFAVFAFGGVEVWAESVIEIAQLFCSWCGLSVYSATRSLKITLNPLAAPLLGFLAIGGSQLLFHRSRVSLSHSRFDLLLLGAYTILFFLFTQAFRGRRELARLAWFLTALCFAVSLFGIAQHFTSEGTIYWFRKLTSAERCSGHTSTAITSPGLSS